MKYEILVAAATEPEDHRKNEGDIIAIKPHPWKWGRKEVDQFLVVVVDGLTEEEASKITTALREDPSDIETPVIHKYRYNLSLDLLKKGWETTLDIPSVNNLELVYQPCLMNGTIIDATEQVAIFKDLNTGTYKYATEKIA